MGQHTEARTRWDTGRVRLRLDVPGWLREAVIEMAGAEDVSISQLAAFVLAYGVRLYQRGDPDLGALLANNKGVSRSLKWGHQVDLGELQDDRRWT